jgi:hypothetical protein
MPPLEGGFMAEQKDAHSFPPVPMVYEEAPAVPWKWEYHVLSIDLREYDLPSIDELNELGSQGWLLVGVLQTQRSAVPGDMPLVMSPGQFGEMMHVARGIMHYYFVREKQA